MQVRTVSHPDAQRISHKVYQFVSEQEMNETKQDFDTYFKKSIQIIHSGKYNAVAETYLKMVENDNIWHNLNLQNGDLILVTKENTSLKVDEAEKKEKLLKRAANNAIKQEIPFAVGVAVAPVVAPFTDAEVQLLYSGTITEVAKKLNTNYGEIYGKRKRWEAFDKTFEPPAGSYGRQVKEKPVVKTKTTIADLSQSQIDFLWNNPIATVKEKLKLTVFQIRELRIEFCRKNPEFKVPRISGFDPRGVVYNGSEERGVLSNELEAKIKKERENPNKFTDEELVLLWEGSGKEISELLNKSYQAVYWNRVEFCKNNPSFCIPAISKFTPPIGFTNPVQKVEPVIKERKKRVAIPVAQPAEPVAVVQETVPVNDVEAILKAVAVSGLKPKTMTLANGVKLEF